MRQLKKDFNCSTLEAAEKKLKLLENQEQTAEAAFEEAVEEFEEKWGDELEE